MAIILSAGDYEPGDQAPTGYIQWHEWAEVQHKAGLRQQECGKCARWKYPQELSGEEHRYKAMTSRGKTVMLSSPICNECHVADLAPLPAPPPLCQDSDA